LVSEQCCTIGVVQVEFWTRIKEAPKPRWLQSTIRVLSAVGAVVLAIGFGALGLWAIVLSLYKPMEWVEPWRYFVLGCLGLTAVLDSCVLFRRMRSEFRWGHLALFMFYTALEKREVSFTSIPEFFAVYDVYLGALMLPSAFGGALYDLFKPKPKPPEEFEFSPFNLQNGA
jgi:hypothetical protein